MCYVLMCIMFVTCFSFKFHVVFFMFMFCAGLHVFSRGDSNWAYILEKLRFNESYIALDHPLKGPIWPSIACSKSLALCSPQKGPV